MELAECQACVRSNQFTSVRIDVGVEYKGLFCNDQVSSLDTMKPRKENKNSSLEKTVLIMWAQICGIIA